MLKAGTGRACITPPLDIPNGLWAAQKHIVAEGLHQDLWVTALALSDDAETILLLDFDLCFFSEELCAAIRAAAAKSTGIDPSRILPFCTHTHAGPITQSFYRGEGEERVQSYIRSLPYLAAGAARDAVKRMEPARAASGRGYSDIGVNRDLPLESGGFAVGPNSDGFSDREVGVIRFDAADGRPLVCLVNYACHATVLGPDNKLISPDFPGSVKRMVERTTGAVCVFLQGAAGNMGPVDGFIGDTAVAEKLGNLLGLEAARVFWTLQTLPVVRKWDELIRSGAPLARHIEEPIEQPPVRLRIASRFVDLPLRSPLSDAYEKAEERLATAYTELEHVQQSGASSQAIAAVLNRVEREKLRTEMTRRYKARPFQTAEMHAIVIGDIAMIAMWGEPYCEIGAEVKRRSPFRNTLFAAYMGENLNYIPMPSSYVPNPPYEVEISPFHPDAAGIVTESALAMLEELNGSHDI